MCIALHITVFLSHETGISADFYMFRQVTGDLLDDLTSWDALRSALPVGTVSGAPKVLFESFALVAFHL